MERGGRVNQEEQRQRGSCMGIGAEGRGMAMQCNSGAM